MHARWVVTSVFAANGLLFGSWVPRIPDVRADLGLGVGELGLALLAPAVGSLLSMPLAGAAASRWGSAVATRRSFLLFCAVPTLVGLAPNLLLLWLALFTWGLGFGALDVTMNAQGVTVERARGRATLSSFHAAFSLGGLLGALLGSVGAALAVPVPAQLAGVSVALAVLVLPFTGALLADEGTEAAAALFARPSGRLLLLGAAAFAALVCEGAAADWSAVYLRADLGSSPGLAGAGFVAFSVTMTIGRLAGDSLTQRYGGSRILLVLAAIGGLGLAAGLLPGAPVPAVAGFALLGLGLSCMVPVLFSAAGSGSVASGASVVASGARVVASGPAIAAVSTCGYLGFIAGPALIGGLAELTSLPAALWLLPFLTVAAGVLGRLGTRAPGMMAGQEPIPRKELR